MELGIIRERANGLKVTYYVCMFVSSKKSSQYMSHFLREKVMIFDGSILDGKKDRISLLFRPD